jgi:hypothetical protein
MKSVSMLSKTFFITISAIILIVCSSSGDGPGPGGPGPGGGGPGDSDGRGEWGTGTSYIHVPIINNIGETITIRRMYIDTPGAADLRVKAISFDVDGEVDYSYMAPGTSGYSQKNSGQTSEANKIINFDNFYGFSNTEAECIIRFDVDPDYLPLGTYTIKYYFRYSGDTEDRTNTVTFTR